MDQTFNLASFAGHAARADMRRPRNSENFVVMTCWKRESLRLSSREFWMVHPAMSSVAAHSAEAEREVFVGPDGPLQVEDVSDKVSTVG